MGGYHVIVLLQKWYYTDSLDLDYFGGTKKLAAKPVTLTEVMGVAMDAQPTVLKGEKQ